MGWKESISMPHFRVILEDATGHTNILLAAPNAQHDPLIDTGGQLTVGIGFALIIVVIAAIVGFFSRRVEYALLLALVLSLCLVVFWFLIR